MRHQLNDLCRALALGALTTCTGGDAVVRGEQLFSAGSGDRDVKMAQYDTLWAYGGDADTLLSSPFRLSAAPGGGVYVLDVAMQQVHHLRDGKALWSWGSLGEGPREVQNMRGLAVDSETGGPVMVDAANQRMTWLSPQGQWIREVPIPGKEVGLVWNMVSLTDGQYVLATANGDAPLLRVSKDGLQGWSVPAPWRGFTSMHHIQWIGKAFATGTGRWGFAFEAGNGWFVFDPDSVRSYPYVEHVDFPEVAVTRERLGIGRTSRAVGLMSMPAYSGYHLDSRGDTLYVLPGGTSPMRRRVLDLYSISSGSYLESRSLPGYFTRFALAGDTVFVIDRTRMYPYVLALRARREKNEDNQ